MTICQAPVKIDIVENAIQRHRKLSEQARAAYRTVKGRLEQTVAGGPLNAVFGRMNAVFGRSVWYDLSAVATGRGTTSAEPAFAKIANVIDLDSYGITALHQITYDRRLELENVCDQLSQMVVSADVISGTTVMLSPAAVRFVHLYTTDSASVVTEYLHNWEVFDLDNHAFL